MNTDTDPPGSEPVTERVDDPGEIVRGGGIVPGESEPGGASFGLGPGLGLGLGPVLGIGPVPDPAYQFTGRRLELFDSPSVAISLSDVSSVQCYSASSSASPRQAQGFCQVFLRSGSNPTIDLRLSRALIRAVVEHYAPQFCAGGPEIWLFETTSGVLVLSDVVFVRVLPPQADGAWSCLVLLRSGESSTIDGRFGADLIQALKNHIAFGAPRVRQP